MQRAVRRRPAQISELTVMILAAGRGTRLGVLGHSVAKVMVPVGPRPLLAHHLEYLEREGVSRVVINTHHLGSQVTSFVKRWAQQLDISCVAEPALLGTAGAVRNALPLLRPGPFIVMYGDVYLDEPLGPLLDYHDARGGAATLLVHEVEDAEGKGVVEVDGEGRIVAFDEKRAGAAGPALVNAGLYVLEEDLVVPVPEGREFDFGHDIFPSALACGFELFAYRTPRPVIDIGTPAGLARARAAATAGLL